MEDHTIRLNKHGKPYVNQKFSQLLHTMRLIYKTARKNNFPPLINIEFQNGCIGHFIILEKPTRNKMNCFAHLRHVDEQGVIATDMPIKVLSWTPTSEREMVCKPPRRPRKNFKHLAPPTSFPASPEPSGSPTSPISITPLDIGAGEVIVNIENEFGRKREKEVPIPVVPVLTVDKIAMLRASVEKMKRSKGNLFRGKLNP